MTKHAYSKSGKPLIQLNAAQINWLMMNKESQPFYKSLDAYAYKNNNSLTENQFKCLPPHVQQLQATDTVTNEVDEYFNEPPISNPVPVFTIPANPLATLVGKFKTAAANKIERPRIRLTDKDSEYHYLLTYNPSSTRIAIKINGKYYTTIDSTSGELSRGNEPLSQEQFDTLAELLANLDDELKAYGQRTNKCSFCNRKLVETVSVTLGYGPICAETYGLPHSLAAIQPNKLEL